MWKLKVPEAAKSNIQLDGLYAHSLRRLQQFTPSIFSFSRSATEAPLATETSSFSVKDVVKKYASTWLVRNTTTTFESASDDSTPEKVAFRAFLASFASTWRELAVENGPQEQVFAIWFGYSLIISGALLFLSSGIMLNGATRIVRNIVTQQLIVLKVAFFILIELMVFPFGCGVVLDLSTLPLFPGATLYSRMVYATQAPVAATFFRWMIGTMCACFYVSRLHRQTDSESFSHVPIRYGPFSRSGSHEEGRSVVCQVHDLVRLAICARSLISEL